MDMMKGLQISFSGLNAQRIRMNVIASNLANAEATRTPEGGPYKRKEVIFAALPQITSFEDLLQQQSSELNEVTVLNIITDPKGTRVVYDPSHPDADEQGYVTLPNVNVIQEMVDLMSATRSYEANVTAINAFKDMAIRALQIGRI